MQKGIVKWFDEKKGYGFIDGGQNDYFVHFKEIKTNGYKTLKEGQNVTFDPEKSPKGLVAKNVSID